MNVKRKRVRAQGRGWAESSGKLCNKRVRLGEGRQAYEILTESKFLVLSK